jgi:hypothetical protein
MSKQLLETLGGCTVSLPQDLSDGVCGRLDPYTGFNFHPNCDCGMLFRVTEGNFGEGIIREKNEFEMEVV